MNKPDAKIKVTTALTAFQNLIDQGERQQDGSYKIKRLHGQTDHDGYTVTLFDDSVQLNIFFHNKFDIKFENNKALDRFISQIEEIAKL